ncbi:hypothetical protein KVT40_009083 [Elsinoe batatas]|uniref:Uncharacterized protein n=1 Tax=Elsinoe batatas TaxID=2601811 RepID=A0A8K0PD07_9PEZI|nr:hypothetical protein KVT40_009083 [Elsinoe batatas]
MQFTIATILALAAIPAFAAPSGEIERRVIGQQCRITGIAIAGNPARPANIDGNCQTTAVCSNVGGISFGNCPGGGSCCFKFDCAGPNSNSACPGRFVNGVCPPNLRCFQLL